MVHRCARQIERKTPHRRVHQDPEVIPQVRARDPERPGAADDQEVPHSDERVREEREVEGVMRRLVAEGALEPNTSVPSGLASAQLGLPGEDDCRWGREGRKGAVQSVPEEAEREDGEGKGVACSLGVPAEELGEGFVVVFCGNGWS